MQCKYKWNNHERATICPSRQHEPWWGSEHIKINYVQIARCRMVWSPSPFPCRSEGLWECRWLSAFSCRPSRNYPWLQAAILPKVMSSSWGHPISNDCSLQDTKAQTFCLKSWKLWRGVPVSELLMGSAETFLKPWRSPTSSHHFILFLRGC